MISKRVLAAVVAPVPPGSETAEAPDASGTARGVEEVAA